MIPYRNTDKQNDITAILFLLVFGGMGILANFNMLKMDIVVVLFAVNGFLWLFSILSETKHYPYSFHAIQSVYFIVFVYYAGLTQYLNSYFPWQGEIQKNIVIKANLLVTTWWVFFYIGKKKEARYTGIKARKCFFNSVINYNESFAITVLLISIFIMFFRIIKVGGINLLSRNTAIVQYSSNSAINQFVVITMQAFVFWTVMYCSVGIKRKRHGTFLFFMSFLVYLLSYPPFGMSRYMMGMTYGAIVLATSKKLRMGKKFMMLFLILMILLFPIINVFRDYPITTMFDLSFWKAIGENLSRGWLAVDYDSFMVICTSIMHNEMYGAKIKTLISSLLFWMPRSIWNSKLPGTGEYLAKLGLIQNMRVGAENISCPLVAELYTCLGIVGVILGSYIVGRLSKKIDLLYWENKNANDNTQSICFFRLLYPLLILWFFYLCRGDLMSSLSVLVGYLFVYFFIWSSAILLSNKLCNNDCKD